MTIRMRLKQIGLLLFAMIISAIGFFQLFRRTSGNASFTFIVLLLVVGALFVLLWALTARFQPYASQTILPCVLLLSSIGILLIARIDIANTALGNASDVATRQLVWLATALVLSCVLIVFLRDYRMLRRFSYVSMVVGIALLLSPMLPVVGREIGGARIWIGIGSHSLQPGEFAKLFLAFFFASYLFDHRDQLAVGGSKFMGVRLPRIRDLGPIIVVWVVSMGVLVLQHDLGTSLMFFAMFVSMLYVATGRRSWIFLGAVFFVIGAFVATLMFSHVNARVDAWLHPFSAAEYNKAFGGSGQLVRGVFGLATGGLLGTGLGEGHPWFTPLANSDFIYSSIGEELGLAGLLVVLMLYLIIIASGMITAMKVKDGFGKLLASGLVFTMAFQVFTVVGGITLVIPLTGLTMPFMAAGGSSMVANSILASLLIVISNQCNKPEPEVSSETFQHEALAALRDHEIKTRQAAKVAESEQPDSTSQFPAAVNHPQEQLPTSEQVEQEDPDRARTDNEEPATQQARTVRGGAQ